jgi:hypothetical protein
MSSYDCYDQQGEYRVGAFPDDTIGLDEWRHLLGSWVGCKSRDPRRIARVCNYIVLEELTFQGLKKGLQSSRRLKDFYRIN